MFGPNNASAVASPPAPVNTGPSGFFGAGNPATGVLPTLLDPDFMNGLLQELFAILAAAGIAPSPTAFNQLLQAIQTVIRQVGDARYLQTGATSGYLPLTGGLLSGLLTTTSLTSTGTTLVPTAAANDSSQEAANTSWVTTYVTAQVNAVINGAPGAMDTLKELADAMGDDPNFRTTVLNAIAAKLSLAGGTMTGALALYAGSTTPTASPGTGGQGVASQGYADASAAAAAAPKANTAGQAFDGPVSAPSLTSTGAVDGANSTVSGDATALRSVAPTMTSPAGQPLAIQIGGSTALNLGVDGTIRSALASPARGASDNQLALTSTLRALGPAFSSQGVISTATAFASTACSQYVVSVAANGAAHTLPATAIPGDVFTFCYQNPSSNTNTLAAASGGTLYDILNGTLSNVTVQGGQWAEFVFDGSSTWRLRRIGFAQSGGKLQLLNSVSNPGTSTVTFTWAAAQWQEVELEFDGVGTNLSQAFNLYVSIANAAGTWSPNGQLMTINNSTSSSTRFSGAIRLLDPARSYGQGLAVCAINPSDPTTYGSSGGQQTFFASHVGGATGVRVSSDGGALAVGNFNLLTR